MSLSVWLKELVCFHDWLLVSSFRSCSGDRMQTFECRRCRKERFVMMEAAP